MRRCSPSMSSRSARRESACQRSLRGEVDGAIPEPVEREPVADDAEQRGDVVDGPALGRGEIGDVERGVQRIERRDPVRELERDAEPREPRALLVVPVPLAAAQEPRQHDGEPVHARLQRFDGRAHRERPLAVAQEPPARPLDHLPGLEVHRRLCVGRHDAVELLDLAPQLRLPEHDPRRFVRAHDLVG